jgi:F-type H+-transporting ATPase subunit gamma
METLDSLRRKLAGAKDLKSVVKTMKVVAALNIGQYEKAVRSLDEYYNIVALGLATCLKPDLHGFHAGNHNDQAISSCVIVFGSDQGLVGQFNDVLCTYVLESLRDMPGSKEIIAVGERVHMLLADRGFSNIRLYSVPNSVMYITPFVSQVLQNCEKMLLSGSVNRVIVYNNKPKQGTLFESVHRQLLPFDEVWQREILSHQWPTKQPPQVIGSTQRTLEMLVHTHLFTSLYRACAESLYSENACRLAAMQRAEKNIDELLDDLTHQFHALRQSTIDEELFDVVSGFEAMKHHLVGHPR